MGPVFCWLLGIRLANAVAKPLGTSLIVSLLTTLELFFCYLFDMRLVNMVRSSFCMSLVIRWLIRPCLFAANTVIRLVTVVQLMTSLITGLAVGVGTFVPLTRRLVTG